MRTNKIELIGHLGADPEVKTTSNGGKIVTFSIATKDVYKDANGQKITNTDWHRCAAWNAIGDNIMKYCKKGSHIGLTGKMTYRQYPDSNGNQRTISEVVLLDFPLLIKTNHE